MNILHLTPDFNYIDGRSYYVYLLLKYLKRNRHNVFLCTNGGDSYDRLQELEIPVFTFPSLSNKVFFPKSLSFISKLIKDNRIQILHSHHRYYELLANSISKFDRKKIHTVFTALSIVDKKYSVEFKSDSIISVSNAVKNMLVNKFGVNEKKISMIPNFVESKEGLGIRDFGFGLPAEASAQTGIYKDDAERQVKILSIGRFHKEKDYETLLKAIVLLENYEIVLTLVGDGEERESYERIIKEKSLNVKLFLPQRNLKEFFDEADICILPSVRDPFPGFMLQSGLHKKPFIGSNADGIAELIKDGVNGLLFEKQNEYMLAEKIKVFIENKNLPRQCGINLYNDVINNYTEKSVIPKIENLYNQLVNEPDKNLFF